MVCHGRVCTAAPKDGLLGRLVAEELVASTTFKRYLRDSERMFAMSVVESRPTLLMMTAPAATRTPTSMATYIPPPRRCANALSAVALRWGRPGRTLTRHQFGRANCCTIGSGGLFEHARPDKKARTSGPDHAVPMLRKPSLCDSNDTQFAAAPAWDVKS